MKSAALQAAYDRAGHDNARLVLRVASVIYMMIATAHWLLLPPVSRGIMTAVAAGTAVMFAGLVRWLGGRSAAASGRHILGFAALLSVFNVLLHLWLEPAPHQSTNVVLLVLFFGAFMFDLIWFVVPVVAITIGWFMVAEPWSFPAPQNVHYIYTVLVSLAASTLIYRARRAQFSRTIELQLQADGQVAQLQHALEDVQRQQQANQQLSAVMSDFSIVLGGEDAVISYRVPDGTDFLARTLSDQAQSWPAVADRLRAMGGDEQRIVRLGTLIESARSSAKAGAVEIWIAPSDGPRHIYEVRVVPLNERNVMLVMRDISEAILAQEALIREDAARLKAADLEREVEQRRKAEDELAQSLALVRATLETTVDGLLVVDNFGNVRQYNGRFRAMWGLPDDLELWRLQSVIHTVLRREIGSSPELVQAIFHPEVLQSAETFHTVTTADQRNLELYSRLQQVDERRLGRVWTFRDVTERARTLQALRQSEANLHALFASSVQAFALMDPLGKLVAFNPTAGEYGFKYLNTALQVGQGLLEIPGFPDFARAFRRVLQGRIVASEFSHDGHDFDVTLVPVYDTDSVVGVSLSVVNTDERVAALAALRSSEESLRLAVEAGRLILWFYEWSARRLVWQAGRPGELVELLGDLADAPLRGLDAVYLEDRARVLEAFQAVQSQRLGLDLEFRVQLPQRLAWVHVRGEPVLGSRGEVLRLIGVAEDVTERLEFQQRLEQARDRAEEANRLKNSILANMSHEIRTPMTSILGFSEILVRRLEDPGLRQNALTIQRGGKRLLFLLDNLIDLAKLEVNRLDLRPTQHPARDSVRAVVGLYAEQIEQKGLVLVLDDALEQTVYADPRREQQILAAVLDNAVRFTRQGSIHIRLSATVREQSRYVCVAIEDTGVGISAEFLPHIFEDFRQESEGMSRTYEGSGLGLSLARRLLDQMDGIIEIESTKGQGTRVYVYLPEARMTARHEHADQSLRLAVQRSLRGVLLVGDAGFRRQIRDVLQAAHPGATFAEVADVRDRQAIAEAAGVASIVVQVDGANAADAQRIIGTLRHIIPLHGARRVAVVRGATPAAVERVRDLGFDTVVPGMLDMVSAGRIVIHLEPESGA